MLQKSVDAAMQDAVVMFIGCVMLAVATGTTSNGWVIMYAVAQLVFGFGVGGTHACFCACLLLSLTFPGFRVGLVQMNLEWTCLLLCLSPFS